MDVDVDVDVQVDDDYAALLRLLDQRYSCRAFLPKPVPRELQQRMFAVSRRTASWCNSQPWQLSVLEGPARDRLAQALCAHVQADGPEGPDFPFPQAYEGQYLQRRRACGLQLYGSLGIGREDREQARSQSLRNFVFFDAPHVAIITSPQALGIYGAVDCGAYVANLMLAAQSLGIGMIAQAAIARYSTVVRQQLQIPEDRRIVCAVSFGYADASDPSNGFRTDRASVEDAVHWLDR